MANEHALKLKTFYFATRGVREYRATILSPVRPDDVVLEIGCEWGATTALLAPHCRTVIGTDISPECVARARQYHPELSFAVLDAFDIRAALALGRNFSLIYIDVSGLSGYRALLDTIALLTMYATIFGPRAIVVKSGALKQFAAHCRAWESPDQGLVAQQLGGK